MKEHIKQDEIVATALEVLLRMHAAYATGDFGRWVDFHHPDVVYRNFNEGPSGGTWRGRDDYLRVFLGGISGGYDGSYEFRVSGYRAIADDLALMEWTVTITPSVGSPVTARGCLIFRVEDGAVTEVYEIMEKAARDLLPHLKQVDS